MDPIRKELEEARQVLDLFLSDETNIRNIRKAGEILVQAFRSGHAVISCGNGGSMCDAMHFAEELSGRFRNDRKALPAIAVSDPSHITCTGNDFGFEKIFSRFVEAHGRKGDVLLAISTSGNSANVLEAVKKALATGMTVIGLTGKDGGAMAGLCHVEIRAPHSAFADRAQEIHIKVIHNLILEVERALFPA